MLTKSGGVVGGALLAALATIGGTKIMQMAVEVVLACEFCSSA